MTLANLDSPVPLNRKKYLTFIYNVVCYTVFTTVYQQTAVVITVAEGEVLHLPGSKFRCHSINAP